MLAELDKLSKMQGKLSWDPVLWNRRWFCSFRLQPLQLYVTVSSEPRRGKKTCFKKMALKLSHHNFFSPDQSHWVVLNEYVHIYIHIYVLYMYCVYIYIWTANKQRKGSNLWPVIWKQQRWHFSTTRASKGHGTDRWGPFSMQVSFVHTEGSAAWAVALQLNLGLSPVTFLLLMAEVGPSFSVRIWFSMGMICEATTGKLPFSKKHSWRQKAGKRSSTQTKWNIFQNSKELTIQIHPKPFPTYFCESILNHLHLSQPLFSTPKVFRFTPGVVLRVNNHKGLLSLAVQKAGQCHQSRRKPHG